MLFFGYLCGVVPLGGDGVDRAFLHTCVSFDD